MDNQDVKFSDTHMHTTHLVAYLAERQAFFAERARIERAGLLKAIAEGRDTGEIEDHIACYGREKKDLGRFAGLYAATGKIEGYGAISNDAYSFILAAATGEYDSE